MQLATTLGTAQPGSGSAGVGSGTGSSGLGEGSGLFGGASPFGESMVDELLPDSFLRRTFGSFFDTLQVRLLGLFWPQIQMCFKL